MNLWLLLDVELQFNAIPQPILSRDYRPDLVLEDAEDSYYGMHFVLAPPEIHASDRVTAKIVLRA